MKTVANVIARELYTQLIDQGFRKQDFFAATGIKEAELMRPEGRIISHKHSQAVVLYEQALPLTFSQLPPLPDYLEQSWPQWVDIAMNAPSGLALIQIFLRYRAVFGQADQLWLSHNGRQLELIYTADALPGQSTLSALFNFMIIGALLQLVPYSKALFTFEFVQQPCTDPDALADYWGQKIAIGSKNCMRFDAGSLQHHNPFFNKALFARQHRQLKHQYQSVTAVPSFTEQVRQLMHRRLHEALLTGSMLEYVCKQLGMSRWTLQRRLAQEQTTYSQLFSQLRVEEACYWLQHTRLPVQDISERLSFSGPSAFARFFREHLGVSPQQYQSHYQEDDMLRQHVARY